MAALTPREEAPAEGAGEINETYCRHLIEDCEARIRAGSIMGAEPMITVGAKTMISLLRARTSEPEAGESEDRGWAHRQWLAGKLLDRDLSDGVAYSIVSASPSISPHPSPATADKLRVGDLWWNSEDWETTFDSIEDAYEAATHAEMRGVAALGRATQHETVYAVRIDIDTTGDGDADDWEIRLFPTRVQALATLSPKEEGGE